MPPRTQPVRVDLQGPYLKGLMKTPFPEQEAMYRDTRNQVFAFPGVRGGKSQGAAEKFVARIFAELVRYLTKVAAGEVEEWQPSGSEPFSDRDEPRKLYWVVAPSHDLAKVTWRKVNTVLRRLKPLTIKSVAGEHWLRGGVLLQMRTGKDESQLQGDKLDGCLIDEICKLPESSFDQVLNRLTDSDGWLIGIGSPRPGTWPKRRIWDEGESDRVGLHHWTTENNPHIPRAVLEKRKRELPPAWYRRDFLADWTTFEGLVFSDFLAEARGDDPGSVIPVTPEQIRAWPIDLCIDFGLRRPGCVLLADAPGLSTDGSNADVVVEEVVLTDVKLKTLLHEAANLAEKLGIQYRNVYVDPAGRARNMQTKIPDIEVVRQVLAERGVLAGSVYWPTGLATDILLGIQACASRVRSYDDERRFFVADYLTDTTDAGRARLATYPRGIVGFYGAVTGYKWKDRKDGVEEALKDGVHDHPMDCWRYATVCRHGVRPANQALAEEAAERTQGPGDGYELPDLEASLMDDRRHVY